MGMGPTAFCGTKPINLEGILQSPLMQVGVKTDTPLFLLLLLLAIAISCNINTAIIGGALQLSWRTVSRQHRPSGDWP